MVDEYEVSEVTTVRYLNHPRDDPIRNTRDRSIGTGSEICASVTVGMLGIDDAEPHGDRARRERELVRASSSGGRDYGEVDTGCSSEPNRCGGAKGGPAGYLDSIKWCSSWA